MSDNAVGTTGFVSIVQKELNRSAAIPAVAMPSHADYVLYAGPESRSDTHAKSTFPPRLSTTDGRDRASRFLENQAFRPWQLRSWGVY